MLSREVAAARATLIASLRSFFAERDYLEVDTPLMLPALIPEPHIEVFATAFHNPATGGADPRFFIPSPELRMKQLLAEGYGDIYQLSHCFRNHESIGPQHNPEFTMLEWYVTNASYLDAADLTDELLAHAVRAATALPGADAAALARCRPPAERFLMAEAFERFAGIRPEVFEDPGAMRAAARAAGMRATGDEEPDDLFHRVFLTLVEPELPTDRPVIVADYPSSVPTLAQQAPGSPFARRWELYLGGLEIANCYGEERDAGRLGEYLAFAGTRKERAVVPHPPDASLLRFSAAPPCAGVALGVDRLLMALTGARDIREVIF